MNEDEMEYEVHDGHYRQRLLPIAVLSYGLMHTTFVIAFLVAALTALR